MKKLFLTIGLVATGSLAFGQGTVNFSNGSLYRFSTASTTDYSNAVPGTIAQSPTSVKLEYGLFYGIGQSASLTLLTSQFGVSSSTGNGLIASPTDSQSALTLVGIPGAAPNETDVFVQMAAWSAVYGTDYASARNAYFSGNGIWGQAKIAQITAGLGATTGPGATIWSFGSNTTGTVMPAMTILVASVPEPTSFALAGLGVASLLIFRRRK